MKKQQNLNSPQDSVTFLCKKCNHKWADRPDTIEDASEDVFHPWRYYANCPKCEELSEQAYWERNLLKAWANPTGPKTAEGKASSASNLDGHPTPDEAQRTRFNAVKTGIHAKVATYFPARPGKYPECDGCDLMMTVCQDETACLKKTELFMAHHIAFETRDPSKLTGIHAGTQAGIQALINQMFAAIAADGGPSIREPKWRTDAKGNTELVSFLDSDGEWRYATEIKAHPLVKVLMDFIHKNNVTMADLEMTPKAKNEQEALKGFIEQQPGEEDKENINDYMTGQQKMLDELKGMIKRSEKKTEADQILIEHNAVDSHG